MDEILEIIRKGIIEGNQLVVNEKVEEAIKSGIDPSDILHKGMIPSMAEVGNLFEMGEFYVPEMLIAARAMQSGLKILKPLLVNSGVEPVGRVVIGTVKGDLHDIGKNLVAMMLEGAGFEIVDLGTDVSPGEFVSMVQDGGVDIIALSALLTTTMVSMRSTIEALKAAGVREKVKVIIGGAPVTEEYARQIGADGYSPDASQATSLAMSLING